MPDALYINPSQVVCMPVKSRVKTLDSNVKMSEMRSHSQRIATSRNLADNSTRGQLSKLARRKISLAVQWLIYLAPLKKVFDQESGRHVDYRAGLATLSLPTGGENVDPKFFVQVLLRQMLDSLSYHFQLSNYIWKLELQKSGSPHVHITLDQYIPHKWLRSEWCRILDAHGLLTDYRSKFSSMSCRDYIAHRIATDSVKTAERFTSHLSRVKAYVAAYNSGKECNWSRPNCTDIHSVKNVKSLAAYMVKYMAKDPNLPADYKGRYWSSSYSLSRLRSIKVLPAFMVDHVAMSELNAIATDTNSKFFFFPSIMTYKEVFTQWYLPRKQSLIESVAWLRSVFDVVRNLYHGPGLQPGMYFHMTRDFSLTPVIP